MYHINSYNICILYYTSCTSLPPPPRHSVPHCASSQADHRQLSWPASPTSSPGPNRMVSLPALWAAPDPNTVPGKMSDMGRMPHETPDSICESGLEGLEERASFALSSRVV